MKGKKAVLHQVWVSTSGLSTLDLPRRCMEDESSVSNNKACLEQVTEIPVGHLELKGSSGFSQPLTCSLQAQPGPFAGWDNGREFVNRESENKLPADSC